MTEWFDSFVSGKELDAKDALLTDAFLTAVFMARQNEFLQWQQGLLDETVFKSLHHITRVILSTPNGEHWWNHEGRIFFGPEFVEFVDVLLGDCTPEELEKFKHALRIE